MTIPVRLLGFDCVFSSGFGFHLSAPAAGRSQVLEVALSSPSLVGSEASEARARGRRARKRSCASQTSRGRGLKKPEYLGFFDNSARTEHPTRLSLRDGHPPHAFRGGGIRARVFTCDSPAASGQGGAMPMPLQPCIAQPSIIPPPGVSCWTTCPQAGHR
jgi:hypothetical protein